MSDPTPPTPDTPEMPDSPEASVEARSGLGSWIKFLVRWLIAIVGIAWVISGLTIRDRVYVLTENEAGEAIVLDAALVEPFDPQVDTVAVFEHPVTAETQRAPASALLNGPDQPGIDLHGPEGRYTAHLAGMRLDESRAVGNDLPRVAAIYVYTGEGREVREVAPAEYAGTYQLKTPQPTVRIGLASMVRQARPVLLALSILVFPVTLIATGLRWWRLMRPLGIEMSLRRAYVLNMVGLFYNSFMLGSTGGDFIKAFYAGKHARRGLKAAAWISVFVDRVIGLIVLVIMGGTAAVVQWMITPDKDSAVAIASLQVAWASVALILAMSAGLFVAMNTPVRRKTGLSFVVHRIPSDRVKDSLQSVYDTIDTYRRRPGLILEACLLTVPVHGSVILSAMLAGTAFDLPIPWPYYFVCVPVIVLSASMPISPQGAGVMEFFAVLLTRPQGATVAQAFALALSIRVVQILWNLTGGIFVLRGGYSAPAGTGEHEELPENPVSAAA